MTEKLRCEICNTKIESDDDLGYARHTRFGDKIVYCKEHVDRRIGKDEY